MTDGELQAAVVDALALVEWYRSDSMRNAARAVIPIVAREMRERCAREMEREWCAVCGGEVAPEPPVCCATEDEEGNLIREDEYHFTAAKRVRRLPIPGEEPR